MIWLFLLIFITYFSYEIMRLAVSPWKKGKLLLCFVLFTLVLASVAPLLNRLEWQQYHQWLKSPSQDQQEHTAKLESLHGYLKKRAAQNDMVAKKHLVYVCDQLGDDACVYRSILDLWAHGQVPERGFWYLAKARFSLDHGEMTEAMKQALQLCWQNHGELCAPFGKLDAA